MAEGVKILDAGAGLMLSGRDFVATRSALDDLVRRGAKVVSPLTQLGSSWVAACTPPIHSHPADTTDTLQLTGPAAAPAADSDSCKVVTLGFKRIVTGPSRSVVRLKAEELVEMGATLVGDVENVDGTWTALCDTGGVQNTGFRW